MEDTFMPRVTDAPISATKVCTKCFRVRPLSEFRRIRSGQERRHPQCRDCRNEYERGRAKRQRDKAVYKYADAVRTNEDDARKLLAATREIFERFRGLEGFGKAWQAAYREAEREGKTYLCVRMLEATMYLTATASELQQENTRTMSDEDLQASVLRNTAVLIRRFPQIAVEAARELGWQVVPPSAAQHSSHNTEAEGGDAA
jgi:hypothetical protein